MWHSWKRTNGLSYQLVRAHSSLWPRHPFINSKSQSHDFRNWGMGEKARITVMNLRGSLSYLGAT